MSAARTSASMAPSLSSSTAASTAPSVRRASPSAARASSRLASAHAHAANTAASSSSASAISTTPRRLRSPSIVGGANPAASAAARAAAAIEPSAASSMRAAAMAARWTVRVAEQVPRASAFASLARASGSTRSNGGGILSRRSSPLALTLLSSKAQRHGPLAPAARAKPVMLITAISFALLSRLSVRGKSAADPSGRHAGQFGSF